MYQGRVKFFNKTKGFGFIIDDETKEDIFVHISGIPSGVALRENDNVEYELTEGKKGPQAIKVQVI